MKQISFLCLLALTIFSSCKKDNVEKVEDKILSFDITNQKQFTVTQAQLNQAYAIQTLGSIPFPITGVASSTEADLQKNNTTTDLVKNIKLQELILTVPDASTEDFTFLEKMDVQIAMPDGSNPVLLAYNRDIKATGSNKLVKLVFTPTDSEMDKYVKTGTYQLILVDTKMRRPVVADMNITASLTFRVTASPLK